MLEQLNCFSITRMSDVLRVSRSGYDAWLHVTPNQHQQKREAPDKKVTAAFDPYKQRDGERCIQAELADTGEAAHLKKIADSMKRQRLVAKAACKLKVTTDSNDALPVAPNILPWGFIAKALNNN